MANDTNDFSASNGLSDFSTTQDRTLNFDVNTKQAEDAWMDLVLTLAPRTLVSKANTWYLNANVKDKSKGLTIFTGGFLKYREYCAAQAQSGYRDFALERAAAEV